MNIRTRQWDDRLLELFEVEREKLCDLAEPGSVVGALLPEFARQTGLPAGIPVVSGGGDQQCAALGHGVTRAGRVEQVYIGGGLTKFDTFNQIQADVYGHTLVRNVDSGEQTALGAWANGAVALGAYATHDAAIEKAAARNQFETYQPDETQRGVYQAAQQRMLELYEQMQ